MLRNFMTAVAAFAMLGSMAAPLAAAPCRDAKGKFIKCPPAASAPAKRCKDAKGKFAKCGTPGAGPVK